jgi:hypothetical protein
MFMEEKPAETTEEKKTPEAEDAATPVTPAEVVTDQAEDDDGYRPVDIFAWANNLYQYKDRLKIDLFLINRNSVVYRTKTAEELQKQLQPLFVNGLLDFVLGGADEGLVVRDFEDGEGQEKVLQRIRWEEIDKLAEVMHWVHTQEEEMELFVEQEHDMKRIKAVMARCTHPAMEEPFYIIKQLPRSQMLKGEGAWMMMGKVMLPFDEGAATLRIPATNELLIVQEDLFVFNQAKLERLFGYSAKKNAIAEKLAEEIASRFKLTFNEGENLQTLLKGNKPLINKLQKLELREDLKQQDLMDHNDELNVGLMQDETGAIILENGKDVIRFVNLLNDDYVESNMTGLRYEIRGKRELKPPKDEAEEALA